MLTSSTAVHKRLGSIPPFPPVACKLISLLADENVKISALAKLIGSDPTFSGRILQYVNSAALELGQPVTNLRSALTLIGLEQTRRITMTLAAAAYGAASLRTEQLRRCWLHTIATAVIAEYLAKRTHAFTETAYTAGLMHDIGRLGLLLAYPEKYEKIVRYAAKRCLDLLDFEREIFGIDHAEAGRFLAERWRLPEEFQLVAGRHHDPCEGSEPSLLRLVHVACRLADAIGCEMTKPLKPLSVDEIAAELPPQFAAQLRLDARHLQKLVKAATRQFNGQLELTISQQLPVQIEDSDEVPLPVQLPVGETEDGKDQPPGLVRLLTDAFFRLLRKTGLLAPAQPN